jgi:hypothetical protein
MAQHAEHAGHITAAGIYLLGIAFGAEPDHRVISVTVFFLSHVFDMA